MFAKIQIIYFIIDIIIKYIYNIYTIININIIIIHIIVILFIFMYILFILIFILIYNNIKVLLNMF